MNRRKSRLASHAGRHERQLDGAVRCSVHSVVVAGVRHQPHRRLSFSSFRFASPRRTAPAGGAGSTYVSNQGRRSRHRSGGDGRCAVGSGVFLTVSEGDAPSERPDMPAAPSRRCHRVVLWARGGDGNRTHLERPSTSPPDGSEDWVEASGRVQDWVSGAVRAGPGLGVGGRPGGSGSVRRCWAVWHTRWHPGCRSSHRRSGVRCWPPRPAGDRYAVDQRRE
jgi:hypothetical protein